MSHAEKCPICYGSGTIPTDTTAAAKTCHGCFGRGWVTVIDATPPVSHPTNPPRRGEQHDPA